MLDEQTSPGQPPEQTLLELPANLWRGSEAVGGRMTITNHRIYFQSHSFNVQTGVTEIPLRDIQSVGPCNTLGIVPNGLRVTLKSGTEFRFVVSGRANVIRIIQAQMP